MEVELGKGKKNLDSGKEMSQNFFEVYYSSTFDLHVLFTCPHDLPILNLIFLNLYGDDIKAHQIVELNAIM